MVAADGEGDGAGVGAGSRGAVGLGAGGFEVVSATCKWTEGSKLGAYKQFGAW